MNHENIAKFRPLSEVRETSAHQKLVYLRNTNKDWEAYIEAMSDIVGPLTVSGRWSLLGAYGLEFARKHIQLEGTSFNVARTIVNDCLNYGYPPIAQMLHLIDLNSEISPVPEDLRKTLTELVV